VSLVDVEESRIGVSVVATGPFVHRLGRPVAVAAALVLPVAACGDGGGDDGAAVTAEVIADSSTPDVRVLAPAGDGPWPVVVALHGFEGTGRDMVELATRVAAAGAVVFVPTYSTDLSTPTGLTRAGDDLSCAYRLARRSAQEYGGDLTRPVTVVGWSLGADLAVLGALGPGDDPDAGRCPGDVPRPDVVVALSGCYYRFQGAPVTWFDDLGQWTGADIDVHLVAGDDDVTCPASQTDRLAVSLRVAGYDVAVTHLTSADHGAPIFHAERDGRWQVIPDDPAGEQVVEVILDAVETAGGRTTG
jgi:dienelactone hydrolase